MVQLLKTYLHSSPIFVKIVPAWRSYLFILWAPRPRRVFLQPGGTVPLRSSMCSVWHRVQSALDEKHCKEK
jgi:hypothetical protein